MTLQWHGGFRRLGLRAWALSSRRKVHSLCHQFRFQPALAVSNIRKWFKSWRNQCCRVRINCLFDLSTEVPCSILMLPSVGFARTRRSSRRFLVSSGATRSSTVSAFMELNLAVPRLQGGVLRSAIRSPQTSERSYGPTCPLSSSDVSPTCLSSSLGRSKYL